jgi:hypothetical protein
MRSPAQAIAWEICMRNRWALLVAAAPILLSFMAQLFIPPGHELVRTIHIVGAMVTFGALIMACSYTANDSRGNFSGFPSWMFTLPLRTPTLVLCPMLLGALFVVTATGLLEVLITRYWGIPLRLIYFCWHALLAVATLLSVQALVWSLHRFRWIRIVALVAVIYGFLYVVLVGELWEFSGGARLWFGGVGVAASLAVLGAVAGVERDRRGRWEGWTGKLLEYLLDLLPRRNRPFVSAAQAQFWFEWRRKGFLACAFFGVPMALTLALLPLPTSLYLDRADTLLHFSTPFIGMLLLAGAIGGTVAKSDAWSAGAHVLPIVATKPLDTCALVFSKMRVAAAITGLGWVLFCLLSVPAIAWCNQADWPNELAQRFFPEFSINFPKLWLWLTNPVVIAAILVATWHAMIDAMSVALSGNKRKIIASYWTSIAVVLTLIGATVWLYQDRRYLDAVLQFLPYLTGLLFALKLIATFRAFLATKRWVDQRQFVLLLALWIVVALPVTAAGAFAHLNYGLPPAFIWFVVALQYFPSSEIPASIVRLAANRHR